MWNKRADKRLNEKLAIKSFYKPWGGTCTKYMYMYVQIYVCICGIPQRAKTKQTHTYVYKCMELHVCMHVATAHMLVCVSAPRDDNKTYHQKQSHTHAYTYILSRYAYRCIERVNIEKGEEANEEN